MRTQKHINRWFTICLLLITWVNMNAQSVKEAMKSGKAYIKTEQYENAIQSLSIAINLDPTLIDALVLRGLAYEKTNKFSLASTDYSNASALNPKNSKIAFDAGRMLYAQEKYLEAVHFLNLSLVADHKYLAAYCLKMDCLIALKNFVEALAACNQALAIKETAQNYYYRGLINGYLKDDVAAEADFRSSLESDDKYKLSYLGLANVLSRQNKYDDAIKYCNIVLQLYTNYTEVYIARSEIYYKKSDILNAIKDISKAVALEPQNENLYLVRAGYYYELKQTDKALEDYSMIISKNAQNFMAYYKRACIYDENKQTAEALSDYSIFLKLTEGNSALNEFIEKAKLRLYALNAESNKPEITINPLLLNVDGFIEVPLNAKKLTIDGKINDQSLIEFIKINDKDYVYDINLKIISFNQEISIVDIDKITIIASDIYHNSSSLSFTIKRTEIDPPGIDVLAPYTSDFNEIFLESETPTVLLEGKVVDESLIKKITVDGVDATFSPDTKNPAFSMKINITGKENIKIKATDIYGNSKEKTYKLNRETARILATNPMGKTWVVFIDNSDYESFANLDGPSKDVITMKSAFSKYDIHNIIEKKNMTKLQMEKFFSLELRDLVKNQKVNSLLIWYAGHGKFINETGYWIPIDAKRDEEFTYFNVNSLKAFIQSYTKFVTHVLVVTDACESGPGFYAAMRGAKKRECGDSTPTSLRSSQVFSSAGYELAADNSPFTKTFAKSLDYNTNNCIAIDNIVVTVNQSIGQGTKQSPKFGKIQGLDDEDGTFFFMKKQP